MLTPIFLVLTLCATPGHGASSPLTLEQALAAARATSGLRQAAAARADGARHASRLAGRWPNPSVELRTENLTGAGWQWSPPADATRGPALDAFAVLTQPIELGGGRTARRGVAEADASSAEAALAQVERRIVLDTVRLYLDALRGRETLSALEAHLDSFASHQQAMAARVREGVAAEADLAKFQAEAGRLQALATRTRIEMNRNLALLGALLSEPEPIEPARLVEPAGWLSSPAGAEAVSRAVRHSPDVAEATASERRAVQALALERSRRVPDVAVTGGYKRTAGFDSGVLGLVVAVPLFERNGAAIAQASGDVRAASQERVAIESRVAAEARAALDAARLLDERARRADDEVLKPAETVRNAARAAFREGASNILSLVDAERVYLEARREVLQVKLDALAAGIEARVLLGEEIVR
jgi:cobalt-zinc-cadmium efflux system outer membrane protein